MSPKIIETKLVISGEDNASASLQKITDSVGKLAEALTALGQIPFPSFEGYGTVRGGGRRGAGKTAVAAQRSQYAPDPDPERPDDKRKKSWWQRHAPGAFALGMAGRTPSMAAGMVGGAITGGGLREVGSMMQQVGGGVMGAFGGFGALLGLPLLAAGATFGLARMLAEPKIQYGKATYGIAARLGRGFVEQQREIGVAAGISPMEMAQYEAELERAGAQNAGGALAGLRGYGITPELAMPALTAITRAGGAGARGEQDYESIKRALLGTAKDVHSIPEMLAQVTTAVQMVGESIGDIGVGGAQSTMALAKWMQGSPSAALRGEAGGRLLGGMMGAIATPGPPGKEMFLWGALGKETGLREAFTKDFPHLAYMMPATGGLTRFQLQLLRERGGAVLPILLKKIMGMGPKLAPEMMMGMFPGISATTTANVMQRYTETGGIPEELAKTIAAEMKPSAESLNDINKKLAAIEDIKISLGGDVGKILDAEVTIMRTIADLLEGDVWSSAIEALPKVADALRDLSKGEFGQFFDKIGDAIESGVRRAFGFAPIKKLAGGQYEAEFLEMQKGLPQDVLERILTNKFGWQFEAPTWIKEWVKSWSGARPR